MQAEDDASCIADDARGYCGTVPRAGGAPCKNPRGRCPHHAEENARCKSALDADPTARCWNRRVGRTDFCEYHVDYPDYSVRAKKWVEKRRQHDLLIDQGEFEEWLRAEYPQASAPQPRVHDFQKFACYCLDGQKVSKLFYLVGL